MRFTIKLFRCVTPNMGFPQTIHNYSQFVPQHGPVNDKDIKHLENFLMDKPNILILTGAGISTESGIPDYRSEGVGMYARTNNRPVEHMEFIRSIKIRQRYWARNFIAWPKFSAFQPNPVHYAIAKWEREQRCSTIITQNVDALHLKAGTKQLIELHGNGYTVSCLTCKDRICRHTFQDILQTLNGNMLNNEEIAMRPDGDVDIPIEYIDNFKVPECQHCGGNYKPDIVFFGDNVPRDRIDRVAELICKADGLLVLGSSLLVFSGYRILLHSYDLGLPIAIVNIGPTRGDAKANIKLSAKCGDVIPKLFDFK